MHAERLKSHLEQRELLNVGRAGTGGGSNGAGHEQAHTIPHKLPYLVECALR